MSSTPDEYEALVAALRDWGIHYLAPSDAQPGPTALSARELISRLAGHPRPRLRLALIPLLLLHPELATEVRTLSLPPSGETTLKKMYTAAACLQRMWSIRLSFYLGDQELLPDLFSAELGLPPVDQDYGKPSLHALAEGETFSQRSSYDGVMEQLFAQLKMQVQDERAPTR